jgi:hypothetical protein
VQLEQLEIKALLEQPEQQALLAIKVLLVILEQPGIVDLPEIKVLLAQRVLPATEVLLVLQA